jgi:hypothetical protein
LAKEFKPMAVCEFDRRRLLVASLVWLGSGWFARGARAAEPGGEPTLATRAAPAAPLRKLDELGVELTALRLSADDFLIDLRYRVKDTVRAQALLEQKLKPVLVNESTGDRYYVPQAPKIGSLRQSATAKQPAIVDRVYFMLFANPDRKLKAGEKVTLYAGDTVVKDLVVQ